MISRNMNPQSFSGRSLLITLWTGMFDLQMCFHVSPNVGLVFVCFVAQVTVPEPLPTFIHNQAHILGSHVIRVCNLFKD